MKFVKLSSGVSAEWKSVTNKGTFFINKSTSPNLGIVYYEITVNFNDGGHRILGYNLQYLRDAKKIAINFENKK